MYIAYSTTRPNVLQEIFNLSDEAHGLIKRMLDPNPNTRLDIVQVKAEFMTIRALQRGKSAILNDKVLGMNASFESTLDTLRCDNVMEPLTPDLVFDTSMY